MAGEKQEQKAGPACTRAKRKINMTTIFFMAKAKSANWITSV